MKLFKFSNDKQLETVFSPDNQLVTIGDIGYFLPKEEWEGLGMPTDFWLSSLRECRSSTFVISLCHNYVACLGGRTVEDQNELFFQLYQSELRVKALDLLKSVNIDKVCDR